MYSLEVWIAQQLRDVDEDGTCTAKIVLRSVDNGTPWQTWSIQREGEYRTRPERLIEEIQNVQNGLSEQFPVGKNHIVFIALDANGADIARFPTSIMGKNRSASAATLMQNEAGTAITQTMTAFADTFRQILAPVNAQFALSMKHQETLQATVIAQTNFINSLLEERVLENRAKAEEKAEEGPDLGGMLKEYMPAILELAQTALAQKPTTAAGAVNVAATVAKTMNGAGAPPTGEN